MEILTFLEELCSPRYYTELEEDFSKDGLRDILQRYQEQQPQNCGLPVVEQTHQLILWIVDEIISIGNNDDLEPAEFTPEHIHQTEPLFLAIHAIVSSIIKSAKEDCKQEALSAIKIIVKKTAAMMVILCASHLGKYEWTSHTTNKSAEDILELLCQGSETESVQQLLSSTSSSSSLVIQDGVLDEILTILQTKLKSWFALPYVAHWCITQVKYPNLGSHLSKALTLAFKVTDTHQTQHKILGVQCLCHILQNTNAAELMWYGRCEVIFEVLQKMFYMSEPELMQVLYPCILLNLKVMKKSGKNDMEQHYDKVIDVILTSMEYESKQPLRRVHMLFLKDLVSEVGIHLLCYFKRLLRIVFSYMEVYDEQEEQIRINSLLALKTVILNLWPRVNNHLSEILHAILKLIVDSSDIDNQHTKDAILNSCVECLIVLQHCCPKDVNEAFQALLVEVKHREIHCCIDRVIDQLKTS